MKQKEILIYSKKKLVFNIFRAILTLCSFALCLYILIPTIVIIPDISHIFDDGQNEFESMLEEGLDDIEAKEHGEYMAGVLNSIAVENYQSNSQLLSIFEIVVMVFLMLIIGLLLTLIIFSTVFFIKSVKYIAFYIKVKKEMHNSLFL